MRAIESLNLQRTLRVLLLLNQVYIFLQRIFNRDIFIMNDNLKPICVDLDGTLIFSDTLAELFLRMIKHRAYYIFLVPIWLMRGRSALKYELSRRFSKYVNNLPFNGELVEYLKKEKESGRKIVLVTACEENLAKKVVSPLGLFDEIYGSGRGLNLKGYAKAEFISSKFGDGNFAYAGNSSDDIKVWERSAGMLIVNTSDRLRDKVVSSNPGKPAKVFCGCGNGFKDFLKAVRIHQWTKNLLVFLPLFLSHTYMDLLKIIACFVAFLAFSLCASATYIINDIFDIESDRLHAYKKNRPLAAGNFSVTNALIVVSLFIALSVVLAYIVSVKLLFFLAIYAIATLSYSFWLKRIILIDVILLAILYMFRIQYGAVATDVYVSFWLASFSIFFFLSLAFLKRYVEIMDISGCAGAVRGRGYVESDKNMISVMGICSGMVSVLLFVIYIDASAKDLYEQPTNLMYASVLLIYFICSIWIAASRGKVHSDPIIYAIKSKESYIIAAAFIVIFLSAQPIIQH